MTSLFLAAPTWNSFQDAIKEQYYPIESYEDKYVKWTTLWPGRVFHTLCTKLGIKYSERNLVLKYRSCLHRYIQDEMEFLNIS